MTQSLPPPFPRDGAVKVLENDFVVVWDVTWEKGVRTPLHEHRYTALSVTVRPGRVQSVMPDGATRVGGDELVGNVQYGGEGLVHQEEGVSDTPRRVFLLELKKRPPAAVSLTPGAAPAWPREGATQVLDNDRVTVWDYEYQPGRGVPLHAHDKDEVVIELGAGRIRTIDSGGEVSTVEIAPARARFVPRGSVHREEYVSGTPRLVVIELEH